MRSDFLIFGTATAAGGIPEDIQRGFVQVITALVVWGLTKLFDRWQEAKR